MNRRVRAVRIVGHLMVVRGFGRLTLAASRAAALAGLVSTGRRWAQQLPKAQLAIRVSLRHAAGDDGRRRGC